MGKLKSTPEFHLCECWVASSSFQGVTREQCVGNLALCLRSSESISKTRKLKLISWPCAFIWNYMELVLFSKLKMAGRRYEVPLTPVGLWIFRMTRRHRHFISVFTAQIYLIMIKCNCSVTSNCSVTHNIKIYPEVL